MSKLLKKATVGAMALGIGFAGTAQAAPFNIYSASQAEAAQLETVRHGGRHYHRHHHRHRGIDPGAAFAIGAIGAIAAGAAIASQRDDYYYEDDYTPRRYYQRACPDRPSHYPTDIC